ncbi:transcriptional regulator domain-containing protein [Kumtagia ephedrae]|uniref:transcriptional regulator domain-containing protein n=1 Tax=Kumtagia ephedrae TaxID=2116701 RepID=UPI003CC9A024
MANAAYLYTLFLDRPALAWEHLRRNPDYGNDWRRFSLRRRSTSTHARKWGLRFFRESRGRRPQCTAFLAT